MDKNIIHIAICFDDKYYRYGLVLIESILSFNQKNKIFFHLVLDNLQDSQVEIVHNLILESGNKYKRYFIPESYKTLFDKKRLEKHSISYFYRYLLIPLFDYDIQRVLYLDTDVLVNGDLLELWNTNLNNYEIAAVLDAFIMEYQVHILTDIFNGEEGEYFNSGVMILKTDYWRCQENLMHFIEIVNSTNSYFADQNAANILFKGKTFFLPPKYNFYNAISEFPKKRFEGIYGKNEIREAFRNPIIIHYTYLKPDQDNCFHSSRSLFWNHLKHSKFKSFFNDLSWQEKLKIFFFSFGNAEHRPWIVKMNRNNFYKFYILYKITFLNSAFIQYLVKIKAKLLKKFIRSDD